MSRSGARVAFVAGAIVAAVVPAALVAFRPEGPPAPPLARSQPGVPERGGAPARTFDHPAVNYRGPIRLIKDYGVDHPAPEVFPRAPMDIVIDDCTHVELFNVDDSLYDPENNLITLSWWDPGLNGNRSLTILMNSASCSRYQRDPRFVPDPSWTP